MSDGGGGALLPDFYWLIDVVMLCYFYRQYKVGSCMCCCASEYITWEIAIQYFIIQRFSDLSFLA